jgi:serine/threonine-protein phosphatase 4 regulatory subunit 1
VCRLSTRKATLTQLFVGLLHDPSRWVRVAACQTLGPFITTFLAEESPPSSPEYSEVEKMFVEGYALRERFLSCLLARARRLLIYSP